MMLTKLTACALALCIVVSVLMGTVAVTQPKAPTSAITICNLDSDEYDS